MLLSYSSSSFDAEDRMTLNYTGGSVMNSGFRSTG